MSPLQETIARAIWRYQECPSEWDFDNPEPGSMADLQKRFAMGEAAYILLAIYYFSGFSLVKRWYVVTTSLGTGLLIIGLMIVGYWVMAQ